MTYNYHLYFDDSGSRRPDHIPKPIRADGMDYFALGGILIKELDIPILIDKHRAFCERWSIDYPLHSTKIRGRRQSFAWLAAHPEKEQQFLIELEQMLLSLPITGIACVVDRVGYVGRYQEKHGGKPWLSIATFLSKAQPAPMNTVGQLSKLLGATLTLHRQKWWYRYLVGMQTG